MPYFLSVSELWKTPSLIPKTPGVYSVVAPDNFRPIFIAPDSLDLPDGHVGNDRLHPAMRAARKKIMDASIENGLAFLNTVREEDIEAMIDEGVMIGAGARPEVTEKGRRYTNRQMPW